METQKSSRKIQLAKYLARNEKNPDIKPSMDELKMAMELVDEMAMEHTKKVTKDMNEEELNEFYNWCEQNTPLTKDCTKIQA